jgi:DNA-binding response OmpR family regulator
MDRKVGARGPPRDLSTGYENLTPGSRDCVPGAARRYGERVPTVLVADDDPTVSQVLCDYLRRAGITPVTATDGAGALAAVRAEGGVDLAVLDVMMGPPDGLEVCRRLRADPLTAGLPIIVLTALGDELDRIAGFETGADDYVTKPFSPRELVLRVQAMLRRSGSGVTTSALDDVTVGAVRADLAGRQAWVDDVAVALTARELDLLAFFLQHPGQVFSREVLMHRVWGWSFGDESTVTVHVRRLREKVEADPSKPARLVTVWGAGYRWDAA